MAEDISEPIVRPSIKVMIEESNASRYNANCKERKLTCRIYFFAKDRYKYKGDNLLMRDILENVFIEGIEVKKVFIPIDSIESDIVDTVLICSMDLYFTELLPDSMLPHEKGKPMKKLNYKGVIL